MKKATFSVSERHERITIRYKRERKKQFAVCDDCGEQFEWLTVNEAESLFGNDAEDIRQNLKTLRRTNK